MNTALDRGTLPKITQEPGATEYYSDYQELKKN